MTSAQKLTLKTAELATSSPHRWADFLAAFKEYAQAQMVACVSAPAENVQVAQGRARQCDELFHLFENAVSVAGRMQGRP